jgi:pimeloyl-ACP methyl ester carboxylesterase
MNRIRTDILEIAFETGGPPDGIPVLLLHGWPDGPRGWRKVSLRLQVDGFRTIAPYLRGSSPTEFLFEETPRVGAGVALAQDTLDLADALGLENFAVLGHDWGRGWPTFWRRFFPNGCWP